MKSIILQMKLWYHLKENHFCSNICQKNSISWGSSGREGMVFPVFIMTLTFRHLQDKANKPPTADRTSDLGISSNVVFDLSLALPDGHNFKDFANNFFTSLPLIMELKKRNIFYVRTVKLPRMKNYPLLAEKDLKKKGRDAFDYRLDVDSNIIAVCWFDNKSVNLVSSFAAVEPTHFVTRYDRSQRKKVQVTQPDIVRVYNQYTRGNEQVRYDVHAIQTKFNNKTLVHLHLVT